MPYKGAPIEDDAALFQHPAGECDGRRVEHHDINLVRPQVPGHSPEDLKTPAAEVGALLEVDRDIDIAQRAVATAPSTAEQIGEHHVRKAVERPGDGRQLLADVVG